MESNVIAKGISFNYLLLEYYRKLGINEEQLAVILMVNHLLEQENYVLTSDLLSLKMSFPVEKIDTILAYLVEKGFLEISLKGKAQMSLKPLKNALVRLLLSEGQNTYSKEYIKASEEVYDIVEKEIGCTLKPTEIERIREWVSNLGYDKEMIINAIKDLKNAGRKVTVKQIDSKLLQKTRSKEIKEEGSSSLSNNFDKNLEETIAITKTKWLDEE